jgi:hypothetical protein
MWSPDRPNFSALTAFAKAESETTRFRNIQRDLFDCISQYVNLVGALTPGMLCDLLPEEHQHEVDNLRLFRDDYELLRDLYIQSFETVHKALRRVIGASNADVHGNHARCVSNCWNVPSKFEKTSWRSGSVLRLTERFETRMVGSSAGMASAVGSLVRPPLKE